MALQLADLVQYRAWQWLRFEQVRRPGTPGSANIAGVEKPKRYDDALWEPPSCAFLLTQPPLIERESVCGREAAPLRSRHATLWPHSPMGFFNSLLGYHESRLCRYSSNFEP
jgi:hypothetical protein